MANSLQEFPRAAILLRRITAAVCFIFGAGTFISNALILLIVSEAGKEALGDVPEPLYWFQATVAVLYMVAAVGIYNGREGAQTLAWLIAVLHALAAAAVWWWHFFGAPVDGGTLFMVLVREGFWVAIAFYLYSVYGPPSPPSFLDPDQ